MTLKADADRAVASTVQHFGRLDILVNAVGGGAGTALYTAEEYPEPEWDRIVDLNLRTTLLPSSRRSDDDRARERRPHPQSFLRTGPTRP